MQPDLHCHYHPEREAATQCERCGDLLCEQCRREYNGQHLCPRCLDEVVPCELDYRGTGACILNLVSSFASWIGLPVRIAALVLALKSRRQTGPAGRRLLDVIAIYAGFQIGLHVLAMPLIVVAVLAPIQQPAAFGAGFAVLQVLSLSGSVLAVAKWWQAHAANIVPRWTKTVALIPPIVGSLFGLASMLYFRFAWPVW